MDDSKKWREVLPANTPAKRTYCITFTPRSGSTWLGDTLKRSGRFGDPREYFNIEASRFSIRQSNAHNLYAYYNYLKSVRQSDGVFGFEIAYRHLKKLIDEGYADVLDDVEIWFFLRRRDFVAQAVSLFRANKTGVFHSTQKSGRLKKTPYEDRKIVELVLGLMHREYSFFRFFDEYRIEPIPLWYEEVVSLPQDALLCFFADSLGTEPTTEAQSSDAFNQSEFKKIADEHSARLIARFNEEHPALVRYWKEHRGKATLQKFVEKQPRYSGFA